MRLIEESRDLIYIRFDVFGSCYIWIGFGVFFIKWASNRWIDHTMPYLWLDDLLCIRLCCLISFACFIIDELLIDEVDIRIHARKLLIPCIDHRDSDITDQHSTDKV